MYKAHPTKYKGAMFRSRLEARWAAFFDLMKWRWDYEPEDWQGWTPDFALMGCEKVARVEIKPLSFPTCAATSYRMLHAAPELEKVRRLQTPGLIVAGAQPAALYTGTPVLTIMFETAIVPRCFGFSGLALVLVDNYWFDLFPSHGAGRSLFQGADLDEDRRIYPVSAARIDELWQEAGSKVQWRAPTL